MPIIQQLNNNNNKTLLFWFLSSSIFNFVFSLFFFIFSVVVVVVFYFTYGKINVYTLNKTNKWWFFYSLLFFFDYLVIFISPEIEITFNITIYKIESKTALGKLFSFVVTFYSLKFFFSFRFFFNFIRYDPNPKIKKFFKYSSQIASKKGHFFICNFNQFLKINYLYCIFPIILLYKVKVNWGFFNISLERLERSLMLEIEYLKR